MPVEPAAPAASTTVNRSRTSSLSFVRAAYMFVGCLPLGVALGAAWVWRERLVALGAWWLVAVTVVVFVAVLGGRLRSRQGNSTVESPMRRSTRRPYGPAVRAAGRRGLVPNVFIDGDSFAETAWPGSDLTISRRWAIDASERVASRFGTDVAVILGVGSSGVTGREHVRVVVIGEDGSLVDALWGLIAPVDPHLPIVFVTDDEAAARLALAHGAGVMPCRGWMNLAEQRTVAPVERSAGAA